MQNYSLYLLWSALFMGSLRGGKKILWSIGSKYPPEFNMKILICDCNCDYLVSFPNIRTFSPTFSEDLFPLCSIFTPNIHFLPICVWVCRSNSMRYSKRSRVRLRARVCLPSFHLVRINEVCNKFCLNTLCIYIYTLSCNRDKLNFILTLNIF